MSRLAKFTKNIRNGDFIKSSCQSRNAQNNWAQSLVFNSINCLTLFALLKTWNLFLCPFLLLLINARRITLISASLDEATSAPLIMIYINYKGFYGRSPGIWPFFGKGSSRLCNTNKVLQALFYFSFITLRGTILASLVSNRATLVSLFTISPNVFFFLSFSFFISPTPFFQSAWLYLQGHTHQLEGDYWQRSSYHSWLCC